jgi:hypothetical protein
VVLHIEFGGKQGFFLARFSVLLLAPGFSRWGRARKRKTERASARLLEKASATFSQRLKAWSKAR